MTRVTYSLDDSIATIRLDDGKVNAMSVPMQDEIHGAFDRAQQDGAAVVLTGRPGIFSAGFDLGVIRDGGSAAIDMVRGGFELAARVLAFPAPVVVACTGHAIAMGAFLALSGDHRIGAAGPYRITANEVAIGLTMPHPAIAILRHRLTPAAFDRAVILAATFTPETAVTAGFLDEVTDLDQLEQVAREAASAWSLLDRAAHAASKLRVRATTLQAIRDGIAAELAPARR